MKLQYIHRGLQFFFITVALEGRPQVLSRLVEGARRPTLTADGEVVQALLVALHGVFPAVRLSDYVIMPDHVHFLMICNYETNRAINPLWVNFVLILSGFTDTPAVPARDIRRYLGASRQFRQNCLKMNDLAAALCAKAEGAVEEENLKGTKR